MTHSIHIRHYHRIHNIGSLVILGVYLLGYLAIG